MHIALPETESSLANAEEAEGDIPSLPATLLVESIDDLAVIEKEARHAAATVIERRAKAYRSRPWEYPPGVPPVLAHIANKATARDPDDRYPSAAAFRAAVREFQRHPVDVAPPAPSKDERPLAADWPAAAGLPRWAPAAGFAAGVAVGLLSALAAC